MALEVYRSKRNFRTTPEPAGQVRPRKSGDLAFVIQKHQASHLHYDFRLELDGVLLSWAVPKGPSLDPRDRRLAMHVEDHPVEYGDFEGVIPPGQYGSGTVLLWDRGIWVPTGDPHEGYRKGRLKFVLDGEKLQGGWTLVRIRGGKYDGDKGWLLIKENDDFARHGVDAAVTDDRPESVLSGRDLAAIASQPDRVWESGKSVAENVRTGKVARKPTTTGLGKLPGAKKAGLPATLSPQLATLVDEAPEGNDWLHEVKFDGYRMLCRVEEGRCTVWSRNGKDWTDRFPALADAAARLPVASAWIDGELIAPDDAGRSSFQSLQNALSSDAGATLVYYAFDLPFLDGYDLRGVPLVERKARLKAIVPEKHPLLRYSDHLSGGGPAFLQEACKLRLEGIISKRAASTYQAVRNRDWRKVKCAQRQEFVIGGYTEPKGSRSGFGALLLGVHERPGALRFVGRVGTGFDEASLATLHARLAGLQRDTSPFVNPPRGAQARGVHWVKPTLVGEVSFTEWTEGGTLRHPSFQGLREDKPAREVVRERPAGGGASAGDGDRPPLPAKGVAKVPARGAKSRTANEDDRPVGKRSAAPAKPGTRKQAVAAEGPNVVEGVTITHPERVLFPEAGITKLDLARHYAAVADRMLPHLEGRPLTLVRCPNGWGPRGTHCFYQKHRRAGIPDVVDPIEVPEGNGTGTYMMANTRAAIVALVQFGVIELHPWGSREGSLDRPDRIVLDFDPDDGLEWSALVDAVRVARTLLENVGLTGFLRTTGGKGLHVVVPIAPERPWAEVKGFTKSIAELLVRTFPDRFTATVTIAKRAGKIFIDYLRNAEGATAIAPYAVRAKANAPVSLPIDWTELKRDVRFDHFNVRNVAERLRRQRKDPWAGFLELDQSISAQAMKSVGYRPR